MSISHNPPCASVLSEAIIPLKDVPAHLLKTYGISITLSAIDKWIRLGIGGGKRRKERVYLEWAYAPKGRVTSAEAVSRMFFKLNELNGSNLTSEESDNAGE